VTQGFSGIVGTKRASVRSGAKLTLASAFRRKLYRSIEELQVDLDAWLESYNTERTHSGKYCYGKTPMQTFIDSAKLAHEKQLDRTAPTADSNRVAA
jgi:hypothetical protein